MLILIGLQIYIIAAAYSTNYVQQARTDFLALWADQRRSIERIAYLEQKVNPEREYQLEFDTIIYIILSCSTLVAGRTEHMTIYCKVAAFP